VNSKRSWVQIGPGLPVGAIRPVFALGRSGQVQTQTVTGTVWHATPPTSVILRLEDGTDQQFRIPRDLKFTIDGRERMLGT
jgi:hypothetical protein